MKTYELIGSAGCGSAIVEMALALANVPYTLEDVPYLKPGPQRDRLLRLNPLGQVPTLVTPDGEVMTESAAMILHLHDVAPQAGLAPLPDQPERARFLNLLIRLVAAIYPTFTYGDNPPQWTTEGAPPTCCASACTRAAPNCGRSWSGRPARRTCWASGFRRWTCTWP